MAKANPQKTKTPMVELDPIMRSRTFKEVACGYNARDAVNEAKRCIQCPDAPCMQGCPVSVPIKDFIALTAEGDFGNAFSRVKDANALPAICGRVCPQESQCESQCRRGRKGEPVAIGRLERFVADWALAHRGQAPVAEPEGESLEGKRVAVIGSGPSGLTCAGELNRRGAEVVVFEALHRPGGVLTYGIPEFRLPKKLVAAEIDMLAERGVEFRMNAVIGKLFDVRELMEEQGFDAVFIGVGAGLPTYLGLGGEGLNGVMTANEFLTRVNLMGAYNFPQNHTPVFMGEKCVVVGGGNVAMDAARTAKRLGARTTVVYRRGRDEMPAREEEIEHAEQEGIRFILQTNPVRILAGTDQWASAVECVRMNLGEPDASGRRRPEPIPDSNFIVRADSVIIAVGTTPNPIIAKTTKGLETKGKGLIVIDEETGETSIPGVFAGGDITTGAATVIMAMGAGKRAAKGIEKYLTK